VSAHRFHVPEAAPGARVHLPEHSAHHARDVLRLRPGALVRLFDGAGAEFEAELDAVSRQGVSARITGRAEARPESPLTIVLAVSPLRGDRMELVVQKATELGVAEIRPVITVRTDVTVGRAAPPLPSLLSASEMLVSSLLVVTVADCAGFGPRSLAMPQSITCTSPKSPTMMLAGLRSRWTTERAWA